MKKELLEQQINTFILATIVKRIAREINLPKCYIEILEKIQEDSLEKLKKMIENAYKK